MKRTRLARRTPLQSRSGLANVTPLRRVTPLRSSSEPTLRRSPLGHATGEQRERVFDRACLVCGHSSVDPAHLVPRAVCPGETANDPRAVIPLCRTCHRSYDAGQLDLSPHLEPHWRDSEAWAVEAVGLFRALHYITGQDWQPAEGVA